MQNKPSNGLIFTSSLNGLSNLAAVVMTFLTLPFFNDLTRGLIVQFTIRNYGHDMVDLVTLAWYGACMLVLFFAWRGLISTALLLLSGKLVSRFF